MRVDILIFPHQKSIEEKGVQGWHVFDVPFNIETRYGVKEISRIWFNSKQDTRKITFEDGVEYEFTLNHKLLVNENDYEYWCEVRYLTEGMDIVKM